MSLNDRTSKLLEEQIALEAQAARSYLGMATWAEVRNLPGAASFLYRQAEEERTHMLRIVRYMAERGKQPTLPFLSEKVADYKDLPDLFKMAYQQEKEVTQAINNLCNHALAYKDFATFEMLQWFVREQREEEATAQHVMELSFLLSKTGADLVQLDQALAKLGQPTRA